MDALDFKLLSKEKVEKLHERIKPAIRRDGFLYEIKDGSYDLFTTAYTWDPKLGKRIDETQLQHQKDIHTLHKFGYHGFFKPSVAEVITCIGEFTGFAVDYFEIVEQPETTDDLNAQYTFMNNGLHLARTRLYYDRSKS